MRLSLCVSVALYDESLTHSLFHSTSSRIVETRTIHQNRIMKPRTARRDVVGIILTIAAVLTLRQLALAAFQFGDDGAGNVKGMDMAAGQQTWYHSARGGRGMCATHADCSTRGVCHRGVCVCAMLWGGAHCSQALDVPTSAGLPKFFTRLGTPFRGSFALSRVNVGTKTLFEHYVFISNPAVAHGQAVLGRGKGRRHHRHSSSIIHHHVYFYCTSTFFFFNPLFAKPSCPPLQRPPRR